MKKLSFLLLLMPVIVIAGVGTPSRKELKQAFIEECEKGVEAQMTDPKYRAVFHEYCECAGEKVINNFSVRELEDINRRTKEGKDASQQTQDKLMKIIKPCLEDLQRQAAGMQ